MICIWELVLLKGYVRQTKVSLHELLICWLNNKADLPFLPCVLHIKLALPPLSYYEYFLIMELVTKLTGKRNVSNQKPLKRNKHMQERNFQFKKLKYLLQIYAVSQEI